MEGRVGLDYDALVRDAEPSASTWDELVRTRFVPRWLEGYEATTTLATEVVEVLFSDPELPYRAIRQALGHRVEDGTIASPVQLPPRTPERMQGGLTPLV